LAGRVFLEELMRQREFPLLTSCGVGIVIALAGWTTATPALAAQRVVLVEHFTNTG
jgi:hypothetical protein